MWIKICGITSLGDAELAIDAGADAIGFVFAESPRRIAPRAARKIVDSLPSSVEKIGVFVDAAPDEIAQTYRTAGLTGVQFLGSAPLKDWTARIGESARLLHVVRFDGDSAGFAQTLQGFRKVPGLHDGPHAVLIDTCIAGKQGGTGVAFDWRAARTSFLREAPHLNLIAAGGLRPENIREAILTLEPWGVDVSSGVESGPGKKDPQRVAAFVRAAHEAWAELGIAAKV